MGSSSSKAARKLPTTSSLTRASAQGVKPTTPPYGGHPPPGSAKPDPEGQEPDPLMEAPTYLEQGLAGETRVPSEQEGKVNPGGRGANAGSGGEDRGMARGGMGRVEFSGAKDDAITKDAMDPQFMSNLSRLGQVRIHDAGEFVPAQAQRTLLSRSTHPEYSTPISAFNAPPTNHLTVPLLVSLLDKLKSLAPSQDASAVYKEYGVDKSVMDDVRRFVNSVSVAEEDDVRVEDGEEVREMRAIWV
ncbi:hypothetical protein I302_101691 [Kwoniella bestiolae CBS 10118]|uniref:Uncharacterized protein n=1 Tax=Kwoniella bestiolae CBS 10118 TaxID=1296100 RepID=A0A1B9GCZ9_9TREE|nr:hypothetical protein I302_00367 [Kwoniella bestiolae CBS 10118]OCF28877.1 hypothetical protein I302_00367 [Kwoniella bestiolae CBS 10118]